jgi:hypothetical protein
MRRLDELIAELPPLMALLDRDPRGYPVPWFVDRAAPLHNGGPDFRIMDGNHLRQAIRERRCWVCGRPLRSETGTYVIGPMCAINRVTAEPPCHLACARWSARACPFLSQPKRIRDDVGMPIEATVAGIGIQRNPGVTLLWTGKGTPFHPPDLIHAVGRAKGRRGVLFSLGDPEALEWWANGRVATREEVLTSIETGLPVLMQTAELEGSAAVYDLGRQVERGLRLVPAA